MFLIAALTYTEVVLIKTNIRLAQDFSVFYSMHNSDLRTNLDTLARDLRYRHYKLIIGQIMYGKIKSNEFKLVFFLAMVVIFI